jgi:hypothetical protein
VMRLCCAGREFGKQLLQRLKAARQAFEEGESEAAVTVSVCTTARRAAEAPCRCRHDRKL